MPGIVGIVKNNIDTISNASERFKRLNKMSQAMVFAEDQQLITFTNNWYGCGCVDYPNSYKFLKKSYAFKDNTFLAMEGEVFPEISEIPFNLKNEMPNVQRAEFCLEKFLELGIDFVASLNGTFAIAIFDSRQHKLYLLTDRFGSCPIYYNIYNDEFVFGSSLRSLLLSKDSVGRDYDKDALAELFTFERVLGEKTLFTDINRILPASILTWDRHKKLIQPYWKSQLKKPVSSWKNHKDAAADLSSRLSEAINKRTSDNGNNIALVSGGIDSRIMLALCEKGTRAATFTNRNHPHSNETLLAIEVSNILGIQHFCIERMEDHYARVAEQSHSFSEGMMTFAGMHSIGLHDQLIEIGAQTVLTGQWFDTLFKGYYSTFPEVAPVYQRDPELFRTRRMAKSIADGPIIRRAHHQDLMMLALSPMMKERSCIAKERVVQSIADHIEVGVSIKDFSDLFILKQIYDKADWGVIRGLKSHFVDRSPALDNQLLDFAISAPLKWKKDGNIVRTALKMVDKRMASLHDANTNLPAGICSPWRNILVNCKRIPRYTLDKLTPFFPALSNVRHHKSGQEVFKMHYSWHDMNALLVKSQLYRQILQESIAQLDQSMFDVKMIESLFTDETKSAAPSLFKLFEIVVTFGVFDKNWSPNGKRESILKKPSDAEINLCHDRL